MIAHSSAEGNGPRAGDTDLDQRREAAARHSQGISDDAIYAAIERQLGALGATGDLLDFGAGTGTLTRRLRAGGALRSVAAADLLPRPAGLADDVRWIHADLNDALPVPAGSFDVVVAAEVIEHLENPRAVAREIARLLRPNGLALLTTPNNESWRSLIALLVRGHFVAFGDTAYPAHITALVRKDLERLLTEAGLTAVSFAFTDAGGIPGMPARTWQALSGGRLKGLRFSDNLLVAARKPAA